MLGHPYLSGKSGSDEYDFGVSVVNFSQIVLDVMCNCTTNII
jgi:hypothetical protein